MQEESDPILNRTSKEIPLQKHTRTLNISQNIDNAQSSSGSTSEENHLQCISSNTNSNPNVFNRESMFVIVDSSCVSNPSSKEILTDTQTSAKETVKRNQNVIRFNTPSTCKDVTDYTLMYNCESREELHMIDINLQSDNDLSIDESNNEPESIVKSFLRIKNIILDKDELFLMTRKKSPLLENVFKMETIPEELSENSLDVHIPSYPGSPRSIHVGSGHSIDDNHAQHPSLREAIEFLHQDKEFLVAAEIGNDKLLDIYIRKGTDVQQVDHLGRNALHLAVCSGNLKAIKLLLDAGVNPNIKDNVGMTPLSLSLMRRPSLLVANMLFDHGAKLLPRTNPMDTGLFIQFAMMCIPTSEENNILKLLVEKGAIINDNSAPGGRQALHFDAMSNNTTLIRLLVSLGADLHMTNHRNETPKDTAETFKCQKAYELLCELEENEELTISSTLLL